MKGFAMLGMGKTGWIEKARPVCGALDAIVRPIAVSPCTSDVHTVWEGALGERKDLILGHEAVGEVVEVGSLVRDFVPGDRVIVTAITPDWGSEEAQRGFAMHSGGMLCGCGIGLLLWMGGTSGGMDLLGMMLIKSGSHTSIGHVNLCWNLMLYTICACAFSLSTAIYSILFSFVSTTAMDKLHMQNINVEVTVVTKILSPEMEHEILVDLHRGITRMDGIGEYTGDPVHVFYILVSKYEIGRLRAIIMKYDPHAFIVAKDGAVIYGNYKRKV
mgnify:CR=1 FL=1